MNRFKPVMFVILFGLVSACGTSETITRNSSFKTGGLTFATEDHGARPQVDMRVEGISVTVPRSLKVSEANRYLPSGDIVWRGDPRGDRHVQVGDIFEAGIAKGTFDLKGATPVLVDIEVSRFHALSEKARYTFGGVHNINFFLTVRDAQSGQVLISRRHIRADLEGFGGDEALEAEAIGQTQKVRITDHLADVIYQELTTAEGFKNPQLGVIQAMNQI